MDNKITKKRLEIHMEYDWIKYIVLLFVCIFVCYMVFFQINANRDYENLTVFVACYSEQSPDVESEFLAYQKAYSDGDTTVREVSITYADLDDSSTYSTLFQTHGAVADVLIIGKSVLDYYATSYLPLDDSIIDSVVPDELKTDGRFYTYTPEGQTDGQIYGIRVDDLKKFKYGETPHITFVPSEPEEGEEQTGDTEFYLVVTRGSANIGEYCEKQKYRQYDQTFDFVRYFLTRFGTDILAQ